MSHLFSGSIVSILIEMSVMELEFNVTFAGKKHEILFDIHEQVWLGFMNKRPRLYWSNRVIFQKNVIQNKMDAMLIMHF